MSNPILYDELIVVIHPEYEHDIYDLLESCGGSLMYYSKRTHCMFVKIRSKDKNDSYRVMQNYDKDYRVIQSRFDNVSETREIIAYAPELYRNQPAWTATAPYDGERNGQPGLIDANIHRMWYHTTGGAGISIGLCDTGFGLELTNLVGVVEEGYDNLHQTIKAGTDPLAAPEWTNVPYAQGGLWPEYGTIWSHGTGCLSMIKQLTTTNEYGVGATNDCPVYVANWAIWQYDPYLGVDIPSVAQGIAGCIASMDYLLDTIGCNVFSASFGQPISATAYDGSGWDFSADPTIQTVYSITQDPTKIFINAVNNAPQIFPNDLRAHSGILNGAEWLEIQNEGMGDYWPPHCDVRSQLWQDANSHWEAWVDYWQYTTNPLLKHPVSTWKNFWTGSVPSYNDPPPAAGTEFIRDGNGNWDQSRAVDIVSNVKGVVHVAGAESDHIKNYWDAFSTYLTSPKEQTIHSGFGPGIQVVARNVDNFVQQYNGAAGAYNDFDPGDWDYTTGTSFAAPLVAAAVANAWALNPNLTQTQIKQLLQQSYSRSPWKYWDEFYPSIGGQFDALKLALLCKITLPEYATEVYPYIRFTEDDWGSLNPADSYNWDYAARPNVVTETYDGVTLGNGPCYIDLTAYSADTLDYVELEVNGTVLYHGDPAILKGVAHNDGSTQGTLTVRAVTVSGYTSEETYTDITFTDLEAGNTFQPSESFISLSIPNISITLRPSAIIREIFGLQGNATLTDLFGREVQLTTLD